MKWEKTDYPGVYIREAKSSKHGILQDSNISIRFQFKGKIIKRCSDELQKAIHPKKHS